MIAMAHEGTQIWAEWRSFLGPIDDETAVFHRPGMLLLLPEISASVQATVEVMCGLGIAAQILSVDALIKRFPFLETASHSPPKAPSDPTFFEPSGRQIGGAVFEEGAGYIVSPGLATQNLRLAAEREGARFIFHQDVVDIRRHSCGPRFALGTRRGKTFEADVLVNASGPHSSRTNQMVGASLPLETRPLRQEIHIMGNPTFDGVNGHLMPVVGDIDGGIYFRPEVHGKDVLVGSTEPECDLLQWVDDPDDYPLHVTEAVWERQTLRYMKRVHGATRGPRRGIAALYDVTVKDWYPIADKTDVPGFYVCMGTSGSSFKTAPVLGRLMAELIGANERGEDTDAHPLQLHLPRIDTTINAGFLSRNRSAVQSSSTVIG